VPLLQPFDEEPVEDQPLDLKLGGVTIGIGRFAATVNGAPVDDGERLIMVQWTCGDGLFVHDFPPGTTRDEIIAHITRCRATVKTEGALAGLQGAVL